VRLSGVNPLTSIAPVLVSQIKWLRLCCPFGQR
jgi:hypothetical protein